MSNRAMRVFLAAAAIVCAGGSVMQAADEICKPTDVSCDTHPFPGIRHVKRTVEYPSFRCFGCGAPTPSPRLARMNILIIDLNAPEVRFKLTPPGTNFPPPPAIPPNGFPLPSPPYETVRERTLDFLNNAHAQAAINVHFFAPFPSSLPNAYVIGLAASRGNVYSAFEAPFQNYAIVTDAPGLNIDSSNQAGIVHRDAAEADGKHVLEAVELWNTVSGSGQILTNGVKTIPEYRDAAHPDALLTENSTYTRAGRHWYDLSNGRTAIGLSQDNRTLVLFTVDGTNGGHGMQAGEVADLLKNEYGVWNALNLDGGGSTTIALENPQTHVRSLYNVPSENPARPEASNFAVYSDGVDPVTVATVAPAPNASGWNSTSVTVTLTATDKASGFLDTPDGWVDAVQYSLGGAQAGAPLTVPGRTTSFGVSTPGVTTVTYSATDAAGNAEAPQALAVRLDGGQPTISGLPSDGCSLWPPNHEMRQVAVVTAADAVSGVASLEVTATSSEPSSADDPDVLVAPDGSGGFAVSLRAERRGSGRGRVYTITATAKDLADNVRTATATCTVAHDQR
jgi:hypothetical protein